MFKRAFTQWAFFILTGLGQVFAGPTITSFSPTAGAPGDQIQLTGSGFFAANLTVRFSNGSGGVVASSFFVNGDSLMTVTVPNGAISGPISIQQDAGTLFFTADNFFVVGYGPYIMSFSPLFGSVNDTVVVSGVHLMNTTAVKFGGVNATSFLANAAGTQITTRVPPGATNGPITVSTSIGTSNSPTAFTVVGSGPFVTGFSPVTGGTSTKVQITGLHFTGVTNVSFNAQPGLALQANSDTLIQVQPPASVITGPLTVSSPAGTFVTSSNFFGAPVVTGFSPNSGRANANVVVRGTNLLGTSLVYFGAVSTTNLTVTDNYTIAARVPVGAATGQIRVVTPAGSAFSTNKFVVPPAIFAFSPGFGAVGSTITITGANLNAGTPVVRFNGVAAATPAGISFGQLTVVVPAGATTGLISVTTSDGSDTNANLFFLPATVSSFSPTNQAPGQTITVTGQNFVGALGVSFNGILTPSFTVSSNTFLIATVPNGVVTGPISVITPAGTALSTAVFYGAPVITSFLPTHGLPGSSVTVKGLNFLGGTVQFGTLPASVLSLNNTQLVATVPAGAVTGPISVRGPAGTSVSAASFVLDYTSDLSVGITNSANLVTVGSNLVYTISIFNTGPYDAPHATFTNTFSQSVAITGATVTGPWVLTTNGNLLMGSATNFARGSGSALVVTVVPMAVGNITDTISVGSDNPDPAPFDNTASITTTVQPLALLSVRALANQVQVSWPLGLTNFMLQFRDAFSGSAQWTPVTNTPQSAGGLQFVIETNNGSGRFYRLKH